MESTELGRWSRRLATEKGKPAYRLIADIIADDIDSGRLQPRDRLPPLRELAAALGINYTTAARAFNEAKKRGLIDSHPGSGTFIRGPVAQIRPAGGYEMTMNLAVEPSNPALINRMRESTKAVFADKDFYSLLRYQAFGGNRADREAALIWLARRVSQPHFENVLVCPGIHSALLGLLTQLASPGQLICVESLVYPGIKAIAAQTGLSLHALERDNDGPLAAPFEEICRKGQVAALYLNPTIQNPTTTTIPMGRREALADVALRYSIPIIEDDAYTFLRGRPLSSFADLAPQLTYYITGTSKCLGPGFRSAFLHAPGKQQAQRVAGAMRALSVMSSPITDAIVTRWITDGTADALVRAVRAEGVARLRLAERELGVNRFAAEAGAFHLWLKIPKSSNWHPSELAEALRARSVSAVASAAFSTDNNPPDALRVCFGGPISRDVWEDSLHHINDLINQPAHLTSLVR